VHNGAISPERGLLCWPARRFPAVHVSVLVRVEDDMEAGRRDDDRDDDVLQWAHVHS
jgi:hypothetical protein